MAPLARQLLPFMLIVSPILAQEPEQGPVPHRVDCYGDALPVGAIQRFGSPRWRQPAMKDFTILPDSRTGLSIGEDQLARWWDLDTGRKTKEASLMPVTVYKNSLTADGSIVAGSHGRHAVLVDPATGMIVDRFLHDEGEIKCLAVARDGSRVAAATEGNRLTLWERRQKKAIIVECGDKSGDDPGLFLSFSPDGRQLVVGGRKLGKLMVLDSDTGREVFSGICQPMAAILLPTGRRLAVVEQVAGQSILRFVDIKTGLKTEVPGAGKFAHGASLEMSSDGRWLMLSADDDSCLINPATGQVARRFRGGWPCRFAPDGARVILGRENRLHVYEIASGRAIGDTDGESQFEQVRFSADGRQMVVGNRGDRCLEIWDTRTARVTKRLPFFNDPFDDCLFAIEKPGSMVRRNVGKANSDEVCFWLPDGETIIENHQNDFSVIESQAGRRPIPAIKIPDCFLGVSVDGRWIASGHDARDANRPDCFQLWETATRQDVTLSFMRRQDFERDRIAIHGRRAVVADFRWLRVIDLASGIECGRWDLPKPEGRFWGSPVKKLSLFPDGQTAFTVLKDGTALTWDISGFPLKRLSVTHTPIDLKEWWDDLAGEDPKKAYAAIWRMAETSPEVLMPFLRDRLRPASKPTAAEWTKLIADLDHREFRTRSAATRRLAGLGAEVFDDLQAEFQRSTSVEARERLAHLLAKSESPIPQGEILRTLRALAVLEEVKTADARRLVEELSHGAPSAKETRAATVTLNRMPDVESWRR